MISNLAYVHPDARIGEKVTIEPFAYIAADTVIGDGCHIGVGAVILDGARIGSNCQIHTSAVIAGLPQDLKFKGEYTTAEIGDNNIIRESVTINRGTSAKGKTRVGSNNLIMAYAHIAHDCEVGDHVVLVNRVSLGGEVEVGDWAIIGGHSAIHQFCRVGAHAMLSGGSLVNKDIPPFVKAAHIPLSYVGPNYIGLRRRHFTTETINEIQEIFRIMFQMGYGYGKAVDMIDAEMPDTDEKKMILDFIRSSKRGILKPYNPAKESDEME